MSQCLTLAQVVPQHFATEQEVNNGQQWLTMVNRTLSSPHAESARAITGRRCPNSGKGEDFLTGQPDFFTETAVTRE